METRTVGSFTDVKPPGVTSHYRLVTSGRTGELLLYLEGRDGPEQLSARQMPLRVLEALILQTLQYQADLLSDKPIKSRAKRSLSYEKLRERVWPGRTKPVSDVLYQHISALRVLLRDTPEDSRVIANVGSGENSVYLLVPDVRGDAGPSAVLALSEAETGPHDKGQSQPRAIESTALVEYLNRLIIRCREVPAYVPKRLREGLGTDDVRRRFRILKPSERSDTDRGPSQNSLATGLLDDSGRTYVLDWSTSRQNYKEHFRRLIVLGRTGSGKSWLLRDEAIRLARAAQEMITSGKEIHSLNDVPVFIRLWEIEKHIIPNKRIDEAIIDFLAFDGHEPPSVIEALRQLFSTDRVALFLDGLDEFKAGYPITSIGDPKADLRRKLYGFANLYKGRIILSSRDTLDHRGTIMGAATEVEILSLSPNEMSAFIDRWFDANTAASDRLKALLEKPSPQSDLARNPLLLTFICRIFEEGANLPTSRSVLYADILKRLLLKWPRDDRKGASPSDLDFSDYMERLTQAAGSLRLKMPFTACDLASSWPIETEQAASVIHGLEQAGVLLTVGDEHKSFLHRSFQEYLTARFLCTGQNLLSELNAHGADPAWREVWLFLATMTDVGPLSKGIQDSANTAIAGNPRLHEYLVWCDDKGRAASGCYVPAVRAFYFTLGLCRYDCVSDEPDSTLHQETLSHMLHESTAADSNHEKAIAALDRTLSETVSLDRYLSVMLWGADEPPVSDAILEFYWHRIKEVALTHDPAFLEVIRSLRAPSLAIRRSSIWMWRQTIRSLAIRHRDSCHRWEFSAEEISQLLVYYDANKLVLESLNAAAGVSAEQRQIIEASLMQPQLGSDGNRSERVRTEERWSDGIRFVYRALRHVHEKNFGDALDTYCLAIPIQSRLSSKSRTFAREYAATLKARAELLMQLDRGHPSETITALQQAIATYELLPRDLDQSMLRELIACYRNLALAHQGCSQPKEATRAYDHALRLLASVSEDERTATIP